MDEKLKDRIHVLSLGYKNCHTYQEGEKIDAPIGAGIAIVSKKPVGWLARVISGDVSPGNEPIHTNHYTRKLPSAPFRHLIGE